MAKKTRTISFLVSILALKSITVAGTNTEFRVAYGLKRELKEYDPANIQTALQATLLEQIYLRLVNYSSKDSTPVPSLATYEWRGKSLKFNIRSSKTASGKKITAKDAYLSLKRLMILDSNTHGDLTSLLCPGQKITNINQKCPGLTLENENTLSVTPHDEHMSPFLLRYFMNFDTSIIPESSIDWSKKNLPIINYKETSGPYFIEEFKYSKEATLKANKNSAEYTPSMPDTVKLLHLFGQEGIEAFKKNQIDHITNSGMSIYHYIQPDELPKETVFYETLPIELSMLIFTSRGMKTFTQTERQGISLWIRDKIKNKQKSLSQKAIPTIQLFPTNSDASLTGNEIPSFKGVQPYNAKNKKIKLGYNIYSLPLLEKIFDKNEVEYIKLKYNGDEDTNCDVVFNSTDSSFFESLVLLNYNFSTKLFELPNFQYKEWLKSYVKINDKKNRLEQLRKIHIDLINYSKIIPLYFLPYVSITKKPWSMNFSKYYAVNPFWAIRKD